MKQDSKGSSGSVAARRQSDTAMQRIGDELRSMYDSITREPIPDKFLKLLEELEAKDNREG